MEYRTLLHEANDDRNKLAYFSAIVNTIICTGRADDCVNDCREIGKFVAVVIGLVQKFFYDVCILLGQALAHF